MAKSVTPSIKETAFSCPHCDALASQTWFDPYASVSPKLPTIYAREIVDAVQADEHLDRSQKNELSKWYAAAAAGQVFIEKAESKYASHEVTNVHFSQCYNCSKIAVWIHDRLMYPVSRIGIVPNPDLPADIARDFEEAARIVNESGRGAAALLRLCIQKLCKHLGQSGKNIDQDIASLVRGGLSPLIQKSLDIVRVIGNESVHPGTIDLNDDRETAMRLFDLVNAIADSLISHPKSVDEMYKKLPETKRKAIERRDS